ncbi:MAG: low molecular weight phosphatase family protein [Cyanobacteria bacterium P01_A01_bin.84]
MKKIIFLCTGNYYRSRFAEHLFNWLATQRGLNWQSYSKGLALERGVNNVGAISIYAKEALAKRGITTVTPQERYPQSVEEEDFSNFDIAIALDESEHFPLMEERFPNHANSITYWLVHDIDRTEPEIALELIEKNVLKLLDKIAKNEDK